MLDARAGQPRIHGDLNGPHGPGRTSSCVASGVVGGAALAAGAAGFGLGELLDVDPATRSRRRRPERSSSSRSTAATTGSTPSSRTPTPPTTRAAAGAGLHRASEVLRLDDRPRPQPVLTACNRCGDAGQLAIVAQRRLPEARPQPLPVDGHLADRQPGSARAAPAGSAAGSTAPTAPRRGRGELRAGAAAAAGRRDPGRRVRQHRRTASLPTGYQPACSARSGKPNRASRRCRPAPRARSPTWSQIDRMVREAAGRDRRADGRPARRPPAPAAGAGRWPPAGAGRPLRRGGRADPGLLGQPGRVRHRTPTSGPGTRCLLTRARHGADRRFVDRMAGSERGRQVSVLRSTASSVAGCGPTRPTAPTTARPARCSCWVRRSPAASTASSPACATSTTATSRPRSTSATCSSAALLAPVLGAEPARYLDGYQPTTHLPLFPAG